jgi:hypothetical protein
MGNQTMKYLKLYNESNKYTDLINNIKDILLDINDFGFLTSIEDDYYSPEFININISRQKSDKGFIHNEEELNTIKGVLNRIKEYVDFSGYEISEIDLNFIKRISKLNQKYLNNFMNDNSLYGPEYSMSIGIYL